MNLKKSLILFSLCLNLAFVGVTLYSLMHGDGDSHRGRGHGMHERAMIGKLDLPPELEAQLTGMLNTHRDKMRALRQARGEGILSLMAVMRRPGPLDEAAVDQAVEILVQGDAQRSRQVGRYMREIRNLLPEEKAVAFFIQAEAQVRKRHFPASDK